MRTRRQALWRILALVLLAAALLAGRILAGPDSPAIAWWVIASGGGPATAGNVTFDATLGQPIAGGSNGANAALSAGYWYAASAAYEVYLPAVLRNGGGE